jgi:hypothetical protein
MTVFVLLLATEYEGEMMLGVYSSRERAESASAFFAADRRGGELRTWESFEIRETELDTVAHYHW